MRIHGRWATAAITALVATLLVATTRSGSCAELVAGTSADTGRLDP